MKVVFILLNALKSRNRASEPVVVILKFIRFMNFKFTSILDVKILHSDLYIKDKNKF